MQEWKNISTRQKSQAIKSLQFAFIAGDLMKTFCEQAAQVKVSDYFLVAC